MDKKQTKKVLLQVSTRLTVYLLYVFQVVTLIVAIGKLIVLDWTSELWYIEIFKVGSLFCLLIGSSAYAVLGSRKSKEKES
jgi:hypothetical protein